MGTLDAHAAVIRDHATWLESTLNSYAVHRSATSRDGARSLIKSLRLNLTEAEKQIDETEELFGRYSDASQTQPCLCCNNHYPPAGEHVRGIQWEPVPGEGKRYLCWECCFALKKILDEQMNSFAYTLLFSHDQECKALRTELPTVSEETWP